MVLRDVGVRLLECKEVAAVESIDSTNLFRPFDPYPFILLNLVFTVVELFQGPLILMSQNREMERDRETVQGLHRKLDTILGKL